MEFQFSMIKIPEGKSFLVQKQQFHDLTGVHADKNYELILITSGCGKRIVGNNISSFENGDLILIGPDLPHSHELNEYDIIQNPECFALYISKKLIDSDIMEIPELELIRNLFQKALSGLVFCGVGVSAVTNQIKQLQGMAGIESFIAMIDLLKTLAGIEQQKILSLAPERTTGFYRDMNQIMVVYNYVVLHIQDVITLDMAAGLLNMAPGSFCRFFKKRTGKSFIQYVKEIRISIAAKMLSDSELPIAQICYESGYNNLANFNFYFKSIMKMTPTQYRKNFR